MVFSTSSPQEEVILTASPGQDWAFVGWPYYTLCGKALTCQFKVYGETQITATFVSTHQPLLMRADLNKDILIAALFFGETIRGGEYIAAKGTVDILLTKYSGINGKHIWSISFGSPKIDRIEQMEIDYAGDIKVIGLAGGPIDFGYYYLDCPSTDMRFVAKFSGTDGAPLWSECVDGLVDWEEGVSDEQEGHTHPHKRLVSQL